MSDAQIPPTSPTSPTSPTPPAVAARKTPVGWIIGGIAVLFVSLFSFPRGLIVTIYSITHPVQANLPYALGQLTFGTALVVVGILLLRRGLRIRRANLAAGPAPVAPVAPGQQPPAPPAPPQV